MLRTLMQMFSAKTGTFRYCKDYEYLKNFDAVLNHHPENKIIPYSKYFDISLKKYSQHKNTIFRKNSIL